MQDTCRRCAEATEQPEAQPQTPPPDARDVVSGYLAEHPELTKKVMKLTDKGEIMEEVRKHMEQLAEQLFGQPAFA